MVLPIHARWFLPVLLALVVGRAGAEPLELPGETWLEPLPVVVDLDGAVVEVVRESTPSPRLKARPRTAGGEGASLEIERGAEAVFIRRGEGGRPLILELVLGLGQPLRIAGADLEITVTGAGAELWAGEAEDEGSEEDGRGEKPAAVAPVTGSVSGSAAADLPRLDITVERSVVGLNAIAGAVVTAVDSSFFADATGGVLELQLERGDAEIGNHQGRLVVHSAGAEVYILELEGTLELALDGGSLRSRDGRGSAQGTAAGSLIEMNGWTGPLSLTGNDTTLDFRAANEGRAAVKLDGTRLVATVADLTGMLSASLRGGLLQLSGKRGNTTITARDGAEIRIDRSGGAFQLNLEQASATLTDLEESQLKVDLRDSRLAGETIGRLELTAERSEVVLDGVRELVRAEVSDTRMELDLTGAKRLPPLNLQGSSEATLRLPTPCSVELSDDQLLSDRISVTGCEAYAASGGRGGRLRNRVRERGVDGNRNLILKARVAEDSHLEVEGYP